MTPRRKSKPLPNPGDTPLLTRVERVDKFGEQDLDDLCAATNDAVIDGEGFGWLKPPPRLKLQAYWRGVLLVPERTLFVARLDGTIVGTAQLVRPAANNQAGAFSAEMTTFFIAPWARGYGLARGLLAEVESAAVKQGFRTIDFSIRADREAAIKLFEGAGFRRWGEKDRYAMVKRKYVPGYFYTKNLDDEATGETKKQKSKKQKNRPTPKSKV